jgi:hypothetical protein
MIFWSEFLQLCLGQLRVVLADQATYFMPLVGEPNPCLRHAQQHGLVLDRLDVFRQANASSANFRKSIGSMRSSPCGVE